MVGRIILGMSLVLALVAAGAALNSAPVAHPAQASVGKKVPELFAAAPGQATIVWVFREDDILSCSNDALAIRHALLRFPSRVKLIALPVGDDDGLVESFLRRERLRGDVRRLSSSSLAAAVGPTDLPAVFVITDRQIREASSDTTWADGVSRGKRPLEAVIAELLDQRSES